MTLKNAHDIIGGKKPQLKVVYKVYDLNNVNNYMSSRKKLELTVYRKFTGSLTFPGARSHSVHLICV